MKLFVINGLSPQIFECVSCGKEKEVESYYRFSSNSGGLLCSDCTSVAGDSIKISQPTVYTLQYVIANPIDKLYSFTVSDQVLRELKRCLDQYRKLYIDREMKSLKIIEKIL